MTSRRDFLKNSGLLIVGISSTAVVPSISAQDGGPYPDPDFRQLDTWIVIRENNTATFYVGKTDLGQGTGTAFRQMMGDELDMPFESTSVVMGRTDTTPDQGGSGGSDAIQTDGWPMRRVAAEARRVLLDMASQRFGVQADQLSVSDAVVSVVADPSRRVTYGELIGGRRFNVTLTGRNINATTGQAAVKPVQDLKLVGQSFLREDIPGKVDGTVKWAVGVKVPGMVHARNVKPPVAGAQLVSIDEASVSSIPGFIQIVRKGNYVAVICEREEQAIQAARQLKAEWKKPETAALPSSADLESFMRASEPVSSGRPIVEGDPDAAFANAVKVFEGEYFVPFHGHVSFGPAHAMADPTGDQLTIYSNDMKSYGLRNGVATFLEIPREKVRVIWMDGPQAYGRTAADDAGFEAAFLAHTIGRPVRIQWMRNEETAWDTKGPAYAMRMRGGLDAEGNLVAAEYNFRAADYNHVGYNEPDSVLIAQLTGQRRTTPASGRASTSTDAYTIPNKRMTTEVISMPLIWETPVRTGNLRDPDGPQVTFGAESFIDEMAFAAGADPVEFRLRLLEAGQGDDEGFRRARSIAVVKAAAETYGWQPRPWPNPRSDAEVLSGRGIAYSYRNQTIAAEIAEVEVNRNTGRVWVKRIVCAHDCGLVVNPAGLRQTVECAIQYSMSRALKEETGFDTEKVTSVDWVSYPSLTHLDTPERIDVVLVNGDPNPDRPDLPPYGAGEASCKPTFAAIGNAIFDATGVRIRRTPFRNDRVLAALQAAQV